MAVTNSFVAEDADGVSAGVEMVADTAVILIHNDSVMDGAEVSVEYCSVDNAGKYVPIDYIGTLTQAGGRTITAKTGMFIRVRSAKVGATTSLNVDIVT